MRNPKRHHGCRITEATLNHHRVLYLENASLRVGIDLDKGAEIFEFRNKAADLDALWHRDYDPPSRPPAVETAGNGLDLFFDTFTGGWQESFPVGNSFGTFGHADFYLHGEVCLLPWDLRIVRDEPAAIEVELTAACRRLPFVLRRNMAMDDSEAAVRFRETATNAGRESLPFAWGHHPAFGPPLLDPGCLFDLPAGKYRSWKQRPDMPARLASGRRSDGPQLPDRDGRPVDLTRASPPEAGTIDNFDIEIEGDAFAALRNPALNLGVGLVWDAAAMPYLWRWDVCHAPCGYPLWGRDYLAAFEPFNCPIGGLVDDALQASLPRLAPGKEARFAMTAGWCAGRTPFSGQFLRSQNMLP